MNQHDWGICECEPMLDGMTGKQIGWFESIRFIQRADLLPEKCRVCNRTLETPHLEILSGERDHLKDHLNPGEY